MLDASLVKLCLPEPPTPIKRALPLFCLRILQILLRWRMASLKKTKLIDFPGYYPLCFARYSLNFLGRHSKSSIFMYFP